MASATPATASIPLSPPAAEDALDACVRFSRMVGADTSLVLRGGGNTSVKVDEQDVLGRQLRVLRVKGSGSDLASIKRSDFSGVRLDDVLPLFDRGDMTDEEMVAYLARCLTDPGSPRPSIETLLHAFIPTGSVFHSHADAVLALVNTPDPDGACEAAFGDRVLRVPYRRPGFLLSKEVGAAVRARPDALGLILLNHGAVTWGATPEEAYARHLELVALAKAHVDARVTEPAFTAEPRFRLDEDTRRRVAAALAPVIRGALSGEKHVVARYTDAPEVLEFVGSERARAASAAGAATPDHILTTNRLPLWVDVDDPADVDGIARAFGAALEGWRADYQAYVARWRTDEPALEAAPRIVLVPGIGMWTVGRTPKMAVLARDIYLHTIGIMAGAEAMGGYRSLPEGEGFRAEYWPLELYKLTLAPPDRDLAGRVALVTGAANGLGRAIALRLAAAGAQVVATDVDAAGITSVAAAIVEREGAGAALACPLDVTRPEAVEATMERACLEYGGVDVIVSNAGIAHCAPIEQLELADWERSLAVNATGHFLVTRAALRHFRRQGTGGAIVFVATKNVTAPGKDFAAYSASKAAEAQLARVAAIEGGPLGVRVNMVNPDAIFGGSHLWDGIRDQRAAAYGVEPDKLETVYRGRTLLGVEVRAEDVAEAVLFLASERSSRTTGAMLAVDGGVREAFVR
ncbi:MAG TPA: bifunctional rhamnulose-1-phosphate aldolase/short-chain dehydrogenase [Longimicrobium sp.]|jgi:rhamnulose-1-phosphate aldolase/alcohol dehydrogenase|uniref:bifunctional rhamnulose-1-phosphate aldolase/short-chain dehydrogenase n=1 Tax=Longimicrobium sp. TaxID=2029185 RepID=UPI002ED9F67C